MHFYQKVSILFVFISVFLCGCSAAHERVQTESSPLIGLNTADVSIDCSETQMPTCPYLSLEYSGIDVNNQNYGVYNYSTQDIELIQKLWEYISNKHEVDGTSANNDVICLSFYNANSGYLVRIYQDDYLLDVLTQDFYKLDEGTYQEISTLLKQYTFETQSFIIDQGFLSVDTLASEKIVFETDESYLAVSPGNVGDFLEFWSYAPIDLPDGELGRANLRVMNLYTKDGFGPVVISIFLDQRLMIVNCNGHFGAFQIDDATAALMIDQFNTFTRVDD